MAVNYTVGDGVARIELADAEGHNALTLDVAKELRDALRQAHSDARVSVVLLTGSGPSFSVGTDAGRSTGAAGPAAMLELATVVDEVLRLLESATRPTIAGVDGLAAGAGLSLVLGCDLAIATDERVLLTGDLPSPINPPSGCVFRTRCRYAIAECATTVPELREVGPEHYKACIRDDIL